MEFNNFTPTENKELHNQMINNQILDQHLNQKEQEFLVPVAISARHVHLSPNDLETLFGQGYQLQTFKNLSQPGQFAAKETVTLVGPKDVIKDVRILGPVRGETQVEIAETDGYHLGVNPQVRLSGDIKGTPGITLVGPKGAVTLKEGVILAATHVHMTPEDANTFGVKNGDKLQIQIDGQRDIILTNVIARVSKDFSLEMHIDTDEANAAVISSGDKAKIIGIGRSH